MKLPNLKRVPYLGLILLAGVNLALAFGALLPAAISLERHAGALEDRAEDLRAAPRPKAGANDSVSRIKALLPGLRALAVPEGAELDFIKVLEARAAAAGVDIDLRLAPPPEGALMALRMLGVEMNLKGPAAGMGKFLDALEHLDTVVVVKTFTVNQKTGGSGVSAVLTAAVSWPPPL